MGREECVEEGSCEEERDQNDENMRKNTEEKNWVVQAK